jgi:hypothetical protein
MKNVKNYWIELTLMRNAKKIRVNIDEILAYKDIILGSGGIVSVSKSPEILEHLVVLESKSEIDALVLGPDCAGQFVET